MALRYKGRLAIGLIAIFLASGFQLAIPILIGNAVDTATNLAGDADARAKNALILTAVLLLLASIGRGLAAMIQNYMGESVGQHIGYELRMLYYEKLQRLSFSYHAGVHTGDLITRGILDVEGVRMFVQTALLRTVFLVVLIGTGMYLMLTKDLHLTFSMIWLPEVGRSQAESCVS